MYINLVEILYNNDLGKIFFSFLVCLVWKFNFFLYPMTHKNLCVNYFKMILTSISLILWNIILNNFIKSSNAYRDLFFPTHFLIY